MRFKDNKGQVVYTKILRPKDYNIKYNQDKERLKYIKLNLRGVVILVLENTETIEFLWSSNPRQHLK